MKVAEMAQNVHYDIDLTRGGPVLFLEIVEKQEKYVFLASKHIKSCIFSCFGDGKWVSPKHADEGDPQTAGLSPWIGFKYTLGRCP